MTTLLWHGVRPSDSDEIVLMTSNQAEGWANLPLYLDEVNYAAEFNWGYGGAGSEQLAYSILRSFYEICQGLPTRIAAIYAEKHHYSFMIEIVAEWHDTWGLTSQQVSEWVLSKNLAEMYQDHIVTSGCPVSKN